jgi:hypothetical protein
VVEDDHRVAESPLLVDDGETPVANRLDVAVVAAGLEPSSAGPDAGLRGPASPGATSADSKKSLGTAESIDGMCGIGRIPSLSVSGSARGSRTVAYLVEPGRLESFTSEDLAAAAASLLGRAVRRLETTARAALDGGDVDGAYVAAYDAYRMTAEALLARQGLRATGGEGSHMTVEDAVSAQFAADIPAFAKPVFERFRRARHSAQYFDPDAAPITAADASWALEKAGGALSGARSVLAGAPPRQFGEPGQAPAGGSGG